MERWRSGTLSSDAQLAAQLGVLLAINPNAHRAARLVDYRQGVDIAREMARLIDGLPGYRAVLTRNGDYGLELWERVAFARREQGDLFLSIHCNTHRSASVRGMEVYFLSLQGATDREAQELADNPQVRAAYLGLD